MPRAAEERQRAIEALKRQQDALKNTRDDAIRQRCKALIEESPELLVLVVETQVAENVTFKQLYNRAMTPAENYHRTMGVWSFIEFGLERHSLDRFADLYTGYDHDLAVLKECLALFEAV